MSFFELHYIDGVDKKQYIQPNFVFKVNQLLDWLEGYLKYKEEVTFQYRNHLVRVNGDRGNIKIFMNEEFIAERHSGVFYTYNRDKLMEILD